ncbi:MAG: sensor histidine kinase [Anaerolineae bacterium]
MEMSHGITQIAHFDGVLHWCVLISLGVFVVGLIWVFARVLIPLRRLARLAQSFSEDDIPSFTQSVGGIPEIRQLQQSLQRMTTVIREGQNREEAFRNALTESQEHERMRIAHEIHDDTIQSLVLVAHSIERGLQTCDGSQSKALTTHLKQARSQLVESIERLRRLIANLRPAVLDELGLVTAIEMLCEDHPNLEFHLVGSSQEIDPLQELAIFRTAQEAIRNAERHGEAKHISAALTYTPVSVTLEVCDDGAGFEVPHQLQELAAQGHYGLMGIRERVRHLGGTLNITSQWNHGTQLRASFPIPQTLAYPLTAQGIPA